MTALRATLLFAALTLAGGALLTAVHLGTQTRSAANAQRAGAQILLDTLALTPAEQIELDNGPLTADAAQLGLRAPARIHVARHNGAVVGIIVPLVARNGYGGDIDLIAGIGGDGRITRVRAVAHRETAGLGAAVDQRAWMQQFDGKSLLDPPPEQWRIKADGGAFDQITGATVTSRAVVQAVQQALQYFEQHRAEILREAQHD
jgi:Na+-translocating ferredoxin:NAD+ oxidoreductase subunit G